VLYFANPCGPAVIQAMIDGELGFIDTPLQGNIRPPGVTWCADNGCFGKGYPGDEKWLAWLAKHAHDAATCAFATAPDVVGDAVATLVRSLPLLPKIRALGYPAALVAQDGLEDLEVPWDSFDALFIGGSTDWKLGPAVRDLIAEAKARGKFVHMGRVNSGKRYRYSRDLGCDSGDGTFLTFGPETNLPRLRRWGKTPKAELARKAKSVTGQSTYERDSQESHGG
jgi:hypothetical protein